MRQPAASEPLSRSLDPRASASNAALHISTFQPPFGAPRFLLDENNAGGAGGGAGAGAGGSGAGGGAGTNNGTGGAAGSGAGTGTNTGQGAGAGVAGGQSGGGAAAPSPYIPEGLADHYRGSDDKGTIDKLYAAVNGFRKAQGDAGTVPDKPEGYTFTPSDKLKPYVANFDKDPVYGKTREIAKAAGITDKQFGSFIAPLLEHMIDGGLVAAPVDAKAMLRSLAPEGTYANDAEKDAAAGKRVQDNIAWAEGAKANKAIEDDIATFLATSAADSPAANKLIEWLRGSNSETLPAMGSSGGSGMDNAAMTARINDDRNNPSKPNYDKAFAAETDRLAQKHYG